MLTIIKQEIQSVIHDDVDFYSYYMQYVMRIQDENINEEANFILRKNTLNIIDISKLLKDSYERTVI